MTWTDQQLNAVAIANPAQKLNGPVTHVPSFGILWIFWCMNWRYQITPYCAVYISLNPSQKALKVHWTQSEPSPICHQLDCPICVTQHWIDSDPFSRSASIFNFCYFLLTAQKSNLYFEDMQLISNTKLCNHISRRLIALPHILPQAELSSHVNIHSIPRVGHLDF